MSESFEQPAADIDWVAVLREATGGDDQSTAHRAGVQLIAPLRAEMVVTVGREGRLIRWSLAGQETLTVSQLLAEVDGRIVPTGTPTARFGVLKEGWAAIAELLPHHEIFTSAELDSVPDEEAAVPMQALLNGQEQGNFQLRVEAWATSDQPARVWGGWWTSVDDRLYQVRRRGEDWVGLPRPVGSIAAEFTWAVTGAIDLLSSLARQQESAR